MAARWRRLELSLAAALMSAVTMPAFAQTGDLDLSQLDPTAWLAGAGEVLMRAPDPAIDRLFQATHRASRSPHDAAVLCGLFDPHAERDLASLADAASQLEDGNRQAFAAALAGIASAGLQGPLQPYDAAAAEQTLKSAAVTAMLLHEGFASGITADGSDQGSRDARCRALGWVLDALHDMPLPQRAAATRLMLSEGLSQLSGQ